MENAPQEQIGKILEFPKSFALEFLARSRSRFMGVGRWWKDLAALAYAATNLKADKDIILASLNNNGFALKDASEELQDNREVVLAAVTAHSGALQPASVASRSRVGCFSSTLHRPWLLAMGTRAHGRSRICVLPPRSSPLPVYKRERVWNSCSRRIFTILCTRHTSTHSIMHDHTPTNYSCTE